MPAAGPARRPAPTNQGASWQGCLYMARVQHWATSCSRRSRWGIQCTAELQSSLPAPCLANPTCLHPLHLPHPVAAQVAGPPRAVDADHGGPHRQPLLAHPAAHKAAAAKHHDPRGVGVVVPQVSR